MTILKKHHQNPKRSFKNTGTDSEKRLCLILCSDYVSTKITFILLEKDILGCMGLFCKALVF